MIAQKATPPAMPLSHTKTNVRSLVLGGGSGRNLNYWALCAGYKF
jgi:hypothetical protein